METLKSDIPKDFLLFDEIWASENWFDSTGMTCGCIKPN